MKTSTDIMDIVRSKKANIKAKSGRREKTHKPTPGKNRYRILPSWKPAESGDPTFFQDFGQHFIKDQAGELKAIYMCTEKTFGKPCAICEAVSEGLMASGDDQTMKALDESKSKGRILFNAIHFEGEDPKTPVILDLTPTTAEKVLDLMEEFGNIVSITEGTDIVITRTGTGLNTEYSVMPAAKSKPVAKAILEKLHDLDDYIKQEFDEGFTKAIGAVSTVSGLLPPPSAEADSTAASLANANLLEEDDDVPTAPVDDEPFEEEIAPAPVVEEEEAPAPEPEPEEEAPAPAPVKKAAPAVIKYLVGTKAFSAAALLKSGWGQEQIDELEVQVTEVVETAPAAKKDTVAEVAEAADEPMSDDELEGLLDTLDNEK
tara:strand:- start:98697 stop:99818 length:1122 start_codon:yes stop_codon:yes gene_type:complete